MVQAADGGGGGGNAGPQEQKLFQAYQARLETLETAAQSWSQGAALLAAVSQALGAQAGQLETSFGPNNPTGKAAAERYREVQSKVEKRAEEMTTASGALKYSHDGLVAARTDYDGLPPVTTNPNEPQTDLERLMDPGGGLKQAKYDGERAEREKAAGVALTKLDTHFEKSAKDLRTVAGDAPSKGGGGGAGGGGDTGGGSPLAGRQNGGTHAVSGVPGGGGGKDGDPGVVITDQGPRGPRHDGDPGTTPTTTTTPGVPIGGTLAGGSTDGDYGGTTSGGSYGSGSTATPTSGSGAGVTSAMGAGVVSGAGAIAASRGGVAGGARVPGATAGSSGAIGRSSSTAARGAIGRTGSAVPGQGSTAGRTGGRGAAAGRGATGAGQGQAGKNGGRGGAGSRGRGAAGAGQGSRGGKKDEKDATQEHLAFADEESWLDDEGANDSVID